MRVHEFAKAHGVKSKDVLELAAANGIELKAAQSKISEADQATLATALQNAETVPGSDTETGGEVLPEPTAENSNAYRDGDAENGGSGSTTPADLPPIGFKRPHRYAKRRELPLSRVLRAMERLKITPAKRHRPLSDAEIAQLDNHFFA